MPYRSLKIITATAVAAAAFVALTPETAEARVCGTRDSVTKLLAKRYKEVPVGIGTVSDKGVMEVYVSKDTASWSILVTNAQGKTCIIAAGHNFEGVKSLAAGPAV